MGGKVASFGRGRPGDEPVCVGLDGGAVQDVCGDGFGPEFPGVGVIH